MAERSDLDFTYSLTDRIIRLSLGELADFSGAKYDGDFSLSLGPFDAVASLGAFEHFCSPAEHRAGRQEEIYRDVFARVASVL